MRTMHAIYYSTTRVVHICVCTRVCVREGEEGGRGSGVEL